MILYLGISAPAKLLVTEAHSRRVRQAVSAARLTVTHAIAYIEACAAFAWAADVHGDALLSALSRNFDARWETWGILEAIEPLIQRAADLAGRYRVRGHKSLHLAAAGSAFQAFRGRLAFRFAVYDDRLGDAAKQVGIPLFEVQRFAPARPAVSPDLRLAKRMNPFR